MKKKAQVFAVSRFSILTALESCPVRLLKPRRDSSDTDLAAKAKLTVCVKRSDGLSQPAGIYPILESSSPGVGGL